MMNVHVENQRLKKVLAAGNITEADVQAALQLANMTRSQTDRVTYARMKSQFEAQNAPAAESVELTPISAEAVAAAKALAQQTGSTKDRANYATVKRRYDFYTEQQQQAKEAEIKPELDRLKELRENPYSAAQAKALDKLIAQKEAAQ